MRRAMVLVIAVVVVATACSFKPFDFNGDAKADYVWRDQSTGVWYEGSIPDAPVRYVGAASDIQAPADYDGDGRYDIAVVKTNGDWVKADGTVIKAAFPAPGTSTGPSVIVPVPGDYDGDKKAEPAWFRTSDGTWHFADGTVQPFGGGVTDPTTCCLLNNDGRVPVPADYDGDGTTDLAVWNPLTGDWTIEHSTDGTTETAHPYDRMGPSSPFQLPVPGDYDGVGHAQPAIVDNKGWHVAGHPEPIATIDSGANFPAQADYDGDGKTDPSTIGLDGRWRTNGRWDDVIILSDVSILRGVPVEFPVALLYNVARITLVGRNLMDCATHPSTPDCAGY